MANHSEDIPERTKLKSLIGEMIGEIKIESNQVYIYNQTGKCLLIANACNLCDSEGFFFADFY